MPRASTQNMPAGGHEQDDLLAGRGLNSVPMFVPQADEDFLASVHLTGPPRQWYMHQFLAITQVPLEQVYPNGTNRTLRVTLTERLALCTVLEKYTGTTLKTYKGNNII